MPSKSSLETIVSIVAAQSKASRMEQMKKNSSNKSQNLRHNSSISRRVLLPTFAILMLVIFLFGVCFGQQTGQLPGSSSSSSSASTSNHRGNRNDSNQKNNVQSNNYAASVSLLTSSSSSSSGSSQSNNPLVSTNRKQSFAGIPYLEKKSSSFSFSKPIEKLFASSSKTINSLNIDPTTSSAAYYNHASKNYPYSGGSSSNSHYSPYLMPISNYYTGSSATVSSLSPSASSPYQYTHYYSQAAESNLKPQHSQDSSTSNDQTKTSSTNQSFSKLNLTNPEDQERLLQQLRLAMLYNQLAALQQYRAAYGGVGGAGYSSYPYSAYPNTVSSLYDYYGLGSKDFNMELGGSKSNDNHNSTSASSFLDSNESGSMTSATQTKASTTASASEIANNAAQLQALAAMLAYRQQLQQMYGGSLGSGSAISGASYGLGASSLGLGSGGFGYPSSLYGGAGAYGSGYGSSGLGSAYSSLYGSSMPTGSGMLSSLAGGLSSLGSGLGVLSTLGMLFG
ncbi:hypothetical protein QR98_0015130 [Sarcoptes scabiei]|uniref:Uncharacterized protein n=1 Tax=Sarcoptes scabiei TaxID=52283 RepID=A0A131ZWL3_SARSC|nr:hypothetical protein QR98_0015130 [Sarcoptes scabiei]